MAGPADHLALHQLLLDSLPPNSPKILTDIEHLRRSVHVMKLQLLLAPAPALASHQISCQPALPFRPPVLALQRGHFCPAFTVRIACGMAV